MDFGFSLPTRGPLANKDDLKVIVEKGEALGFAYFTISDHIVIPKSIAPEYPYAKDGRLITPDDWLEQLTVLSWLAAVSDKARLLTSVMVVPHRNPVHTAKILATIDVLSGGRVTIGCGAGWMREEFEAIGTPPFDERGKVTDEYLEVFKELWTSDTPSYAGAYSRFDDIVFEPKPVQDPHIPIWIGGESGAALRRTVRYGDCWHPYRFSLQWLEEEALPRLGQLAEDEGKSAFAHLGLPGAALTLKQGFGRLIRREDDYGVVALLDERVHTKGYGKRLLGALPDAHRVSTVHELKEFVAGWPEVSRDK